MVDQRRQSEDNRDIAREDIKKLLKTFGVKAEQTIMEYLDQHPEAGPLTLRFIIEDHTDYGEFQPVDKLKMNVEGDIRR